MTKCPPNQAPVTPVQPMPMRPVHHQHAKAGKPVRMTVAKPGVSHRASHGRK